MINSYTTGLAPAVLTYMLSTELKKFGGHVDSQEIGLPVSSNGLVLPCGASGSCLLYTSKQLVMKLVEKKARSL